MSKIIYLLIYLLIGMIYAGLTFKKTMKAIAKLNLDKEEIALVKSDNETEEIKAKVAGVFIIGALASLVKIVFYPFIIVARVVK